MLRRFFVFISIFAILLSFFCFSVSATDSFSANFVWSDDLHVFGSVIPFVPSPGTYTYTINITSDGVYFDQLSGSCFLTSSSWNGYSGTMFQFDNVFGIINVFFGENSGDFQGIILDESLLPLQNPYPIPIEFELELIKVFQPNFEDATSTGLSSAISWVKSVTDSLISGDLVNLLAIGALSISISLLLLTAKLIRKFAWGS